MKDNAFTRGILPAMLMALSVGQIYAFTNFSSEIASKIGASQQGVQLAFSLGIFFLGMGAAFFGKIVERNIKMSALIGTALFIAGMSVTQLAVNYGSLWLLYAGYGFMLGLGTGIIYITPVKTMLLWMPKHKALASAVPIVFFGLGSTLSTLLWKQFGETVGLDRIFMMYSAIYVVMMATGGLLLKKPKVESQNTAVIDNGFKYSNLMKEPFFLCSWLFMFLNISAGLCLIPLAKQMMTQKSVGYAVSTAMAFVAWSGLFNGGGRLVFAYASDRLKTRMHIILIIIGLSIAMVGGAWCLPATTGVSLLVINACYGAGFSVIPAILSDKFGMDNLSKIHGAVLSAWGVAGLVGNQLALIVDKRFGIPVMALVMAMHALNLLNYVLMKKKSA